MQVIEISGMNILEVTEDKIFQVLGKGRDPKFKPIDKRTINTFGQHQRYCAGVATPDPGEAPPMAEFSMKSPVAY